MVFLLSFALLVGSVEVRSDDVTGGTGCQQELTKYCPGWETEGKAACLKCAAANFNKLEKNCTMKVITKKCTDGPPSPGPSPSPHPPPPGPPDPPAPPPTPPVPPNPGAMQPHILLHVTDDQGWANIGFNNEGNVLTPHADKLAAEGIILSRQYTFRWCAPTRSALMTGRLPYHVLQNTDHVDRGFNMIAAKLKQVGYASHQVGKWHLGETSEWMTPVGRGFDSSLGYLSGGEDHYTQFQSSVGVFGCVGVDLYKSDAPAYGYDTAPPAFKYNRGPWWVVPRPACDGRPRYNGTYAAYIYSTEGERLIAEHDPLSGPLFIYFASQVMHAPQEVPACFSDLYPSPKYSSDYAIMNGMASAADEVLGNTTQALRDRGMWENTLLIYTSDNGGPAGQLSSGHSGNNFPLRGGKTNFFEGGIRVAAFVSGGIIPQARRGNTLDGYIHVCDWYPTILGLAGGDPTDEHPGLPSVDGLDMWPYLAGNVTSSPRTEMMIGTEPNVGKNGPSPYWNGALISGDFKLILGMQSYGFWQAPVYPNATTNHSAEHVFQCNDGCLFNIQDDPSEYTDLATTMPGKLKEMYALFVERNKTTFQAAKKGVDAEKCEAYVKAHNGFLGPWDV